MSYMSFSSKEGYVQIGGRERARMGSLVDDIAWALHRRGETHLLSPMEEYQAKASWVHGGFSMGEAERERRFGERLGYACLVGNDELKLLAHMYGQCEIHGWVHPRFGAWFADLIERAFAHGLLGEDIRNTYGPWQDVADLARRSTTPLVSSYSVTDDWPSPRLIAMYRPDLLAIDEEAEEEGDDPYEAWNSLSDDERQRVADEAIASLGPEWHPAEWGIWADLVSDRNPWLDYERTNG
jgi:hypothetical protein